MGATETRETKIAQEIDSIVRQIVSKYHPIKIILFGSAARGDFERANDLDFLIIKDDVPYFGIDRMRELDEIIDRNIAADMLVYRSAEFNERVALGDPFIKTILKEGRVLWPTDYTKDKAILAQTAAEAIRDTVKACLN